METFEHNEIPATEPQLVLTEEAQYYLQKAGQWSNFLGIMGFIGTGVIAIMALFIGTLFSTMAAMNPMMAGAAGMGSAMTIVYLLLAVVSFFFALYLYQFGSRAKSGVLHNNTIEITAALGKLKSFFKLWGIFTIIYIAVIILALLGPIILGVSTGSFMR